MNKFLINLGSLLIGNTIERMVCVATIVAIVLLSGCATAEKVENPTNQMDARSAQALALSRIGESATDAETKRMALMAVALLGANSGSPIPQVVAPRTTAEAVLTFLDRTTERILGIAPALFAYRGVVKQSETSVALGLQNRDIQMNASNNFLGLGVAGIQGTASVGSSGFLALGAALNRPVVPTTQVQVSGNTGPVLLGGGALTSGSYNPTNPSPVVCVPGTTGPNCSR
jgi:outer membrane murein-binding lipoprotein Lpp